MVIEESKNLYKPIIDFLRAFAVLAVLINHLNEEFLPSGFLGVDIFFVISGYVITQSLYTRSSQSPKFFIEDFYKRRIKRIIPALLIFIVLTSFFTFLFFKSTADFSFSAIFSSLGLSNLYFWKTIDSGYFGNQLEYNPFTNTWSLGVEEQFYLIYPIIFLFIRKKNINKILFFLVLFCSFSLLLFLMSDNNSSYFLPTHRAWEFISGCLVYFLALKYSTNFPKDSRIKTEWNINFISFASILVIFFSIIILSEFNYFSNLLIVFLTSIIIFNYHSLPTPIFLSNKIFIYFGKRSYSIYLWHWPIIVFIKSTIGLTIINSLIAFILTFTISEFSYSFIEKPFRSKNSYLYKLINVRILSILSIITSSLISIYQIFLPNALFIGSSVRANNFLNHNIYKNRKKILFIGDSHALQHFGLAEELKYKHNLNPIIYSYSTRTFPLRNFLPKSTIDFFNVKKIFSFAINNNYYDLINKLSADDFVVISERNSLKLESEFLEKELDFILSKGIKIIVFLPTLEFDKPYSRDGLLNLELCVKDWFRKKIDKKRCNGDYSDVIKREDSINLKKTKEVNIFVDKLAKKGYKIKTLDVNESLCSKELVYCSTKDLEGNQIFFDTDHVTVKGSKKLTSQILNILNDNSW